MHILVVDDQDPVREMATRALRVKGYTVTPAASGEEALAMAGPFDLALLDVLMPKMNGAELASRLWQRWPTLPILFMSGHVGNVVLPPGATLINKPFRLDDLYFRVEEAVNGRTTTDRSDSG